MVTEIIKIIEGGLNQDILKVANYASILAENLEKDGDAVFARRIKNALKSKHGSLASLDSLSSKPVDSETRMDIVEVSHPSILDEHIIFDKYILESLETFLSAYKKRDELISAGLQAQSTLLLYGPPGCGKTSVAKILSEKLNLPLITARLDGLVSSLLGSTAKNIRKIFEYATQQPCVLFLDEFDVVAKLRDDKNELGELKRVVNSLIQNIDEFDNASILVAATNHHEMLDPAIWRRFNTVLELPLPNRDTISSIVNFELKTQKNDIQNSKKRFEIIVKEFIGLSHSAIRTILSNALRQTVLNPQKDASLSECTLLKEIFMHKRHASCTEAELIQYLLNNGISHRRLHDTLNIPLRLIRDVSVSIRKEKNHHEQ